MKVFPMFSMLIVPRPGEKCKNNPRYCNGRPLLTLLRHRDDSQKWPLSPPKQTLGSPEKMAYEGEALKDDS